ncbi:N-acetyltransferase family protein [Nocardioides sp.]|uniref:GNAT family N-acetyltransferase n=1 Tax=Nocardioides sp. TaxID=35761 RepID=UPI003564C4CE
MILPADVVIRPATPDDAEALTHLHLDCWDDAYAGLVDRALLGARRADVPARIEKWRANLAERETLLAETTDGLVGFATAGPARDEDAPAELEVWALYVRAAHWGTGVGHALLQAAIGEHPAYLCVLEGNDRAIRFYERQGFRPDGQVSDADEGRHVRMVRR